MKTCLIVSFLMSMITSPSVTSVLSESVCISTIPGSVGCKVCNAALGFYTSSLNECTRNCIDDCLFISPDGTRCSLCRPGMIPSGATCVVPVVGSTCKSIDAAGNCEWCAADHYPSGTSCTAVTTPITDCAYYSDDTTCRLCKPGFTLWNNECTALVANCIQNLGPSCLVCNDGFSSQQISSLNPNQQSSSQDWFVFLAFASAPTLLTKCNDLSVSNCATYKINGGCATCNADFFLDATSNCVDASPLDANCAVYSAAGVCSECNTGYFVDSGACTANPSTAIPNCNTYNSATTCKYCDSGYYPALPNLCVQVSVTLVHCLYYKEDGVCAKCSTTALLTSSGRCINHCKQVAGSVCTLCAPSYYPNSAGDCINANNAITNCEYYTSLTHCKYCANGFDLLPAGTCSTTASTYAITNCKYTAAPTCNLCKPGNYPNATGDCVAAGLSSASANCLIYASETTCKVCNISHYMDYVTNTCSPLPDNAKCMYKDWTCENI